MKKILFYLPIYFLLDVAVLHSPGFKPGETIAIFGPGRVGLMAAYSAKLQGASKYYY